MELVILVRVQAPEPDSLPIHSRSLNRLLNSHLAVIEQGNSQQKNAQRPEAGQGVARAILRREAQLAPAGSSGGDRENRKGDVAKLRQDFFLDVAQTVGMGE